MNDKRNYVEINGELLAKAWDIFPRGCGVNPEDYEIRFNHELEVIAIFDKHGNVIARSLY